MTRLRKMPSTGEKSARGDSRVTGCQSLWSAEAKARAVRTPYGDRRHPRPQRCPRRPDMGGSVLQSTPSDVERRESAIALGQRHLTYVLAGEVAHALGRRDGREGLTCVDVAGRGDG